MYCLVQFFFAAGAVVPGCQYVCTYGESKEEVEHQLYDGVVGTYCSQGVVPGKTAHYYDISSVEQQLQSGGAYEWYGKQAYLLQKRAVAHIYLIILRHIYIFLP